MNYRIETKESFCIVGVLYRWKKKLRKICSDSLQMAGDFREWNPAEAGRQDGQRAHGSAGRQLL